MKLSVFMLELQLQHFKYIYIYMFLFKSDERIFISRTLPQLP